MKSAPARTVTNTRNCRRTWEARRNARLIQFNKIVLKACRTNPRLRYRDAEEMMSDLLAFQFCHRGLFEEGRARSISKLMGILGLLVAAGIVSFLIFHLALLLLHSK